MFFIFVLFIIFPSYRYHNIEYGIPIDSLRYIYGSGNPKLWPKPTIDSGVVNFQDIGVLPKMQYPEDNPYSEDKEYLGKVLFFDPRLSVSKQIACASCHDPEFAWADGRRVSYGHNRKQGKRNSMTIINVGYYKNSFFWDGRAESLEEQIKFPLKDPLEMHSSDSISVSNIKDIEGYKILFEKAFGSNEINYRRIKKAIATFERSITSGNTKFDVFISGKKEVYSDKEVLGLHLFRTKARCINCHNTPLFSDSQHHNEGLVYYKRKYEDLGRYNHTKKAEDVGKMRTPSLREVSRTAPYMHNGLFPHLKGVINMYDAGMVHMKKTPKYENDSLFPVTSKLLKPLGLTQLEKEALEAFLETLSSRYYRVHPPDLPE